MEHSERQEEREHEIASDLDRLDEQSEQMDERTDDLQKQVDDARDDFESKRHSPEVPGAQPPAEEARDEPPTGPGPGTPPDDDDSTGDRE